MEKKIKCPVCKSDDLEYYRHDHDDQGIIWEVEVKCLSCGRTADEEEWDNLTSKDKLILENLKLTEQLEALKGRVDRLVDSMKNMRDVNLTMLNHEHDDTMRAFLESKILVYSKLIEIICGTGDRDV